MTTVSISLTDEQAEELAALAQAQQKTPEETLAAIVQAALPTSPSSKTLSVLDILGIFATGGSPDSRLHDQIVAEEADSPHKSNADAHLRWKSLEIADMPTEADLKVHPLLRGMGLFNAGEPHWVDRHDEVIADEAMNTHDEH